MGIRIYKIQTMLRIHIGNTFWFFNYRIFGYEWIIFKKNNGPYLLGLLNTRALRTGCLQGADRRSAYFSCGEYYFCFHHMFISNFVGPIHKIQKYDVQSQRVSVDTFGCLFLLAVSIKVIQKWYPTPNRDREKSSGQANLFSIWTIWALDRIRSTWVCCTVILWNSSHCIRC